MNNFEQWKKSLTLEKEARWRHESEDMQTCRACPANLYCNERPGNSCEQNFKEWVEGNVGD